MNAHGIESVFIVEKVTAEPLPERCRQHYPKYRIRSYERATRLVDHTTMDENGEIIITVDLEKADEPEAETIGTLYPLDIEDDCYVVLTTSDYASHMHINTMDVFAPHYPVPNYMRKRLNESYQKYLKKHNDR